MKTLPANSARAARRAYQRAWYAANRKRVLAKERARYFSDPEFMARKKATARAWCLQNKERSDAQKTASRRRRIAKILVQNKKYLRRNPQKAKAGAAMRYAVRTGRLVRGPCETCGSRKHVDGHHDDYSKPLTVRWLCRGCHRRHHARGDATERGLTRSRHAAGLSAAQGKKP